MVGFKSCRLATLPAAALPATLRWLTLTDNHLTSLPPELGELPGLQKVLLTGNQLTELPRTLVRSQSLQLLRLAANHLTEMPIELADLPHLAWYGDASNSYSQVRNQAEQTITWSELVCGELLGESPSSAVRRAQFRSTGEAVAVKLYKGSLASDGKPSDDSAAWIAAGEHPHLVPVRGQIIDHPSGQAGLVLGLVPPSYQPLGQPPSLTSCTRDVFSPDRRFTAGFCVQVLQGVAAALQHLHSLGIAHGDVYAHNILVNPAGDSLLGDFGAATFYDPVFEPLRERIDVRAFGYLVDDLLTHLSPAAQTGEQRIREDLGALRAACLVDQPMQRPTFKTLQSELQSLVI
jgi:hypothetical protein